jgi:hypothetical protein
MVGEALSAKPEPIVVKIFLLEFKLGCLFLR